MDQDNPIRDWIRTGLFGLGLFVMGALLSFAYSYRPLHGSMTWKVAELERRLDERNLENMKLGDELTRLRSEQTEQVAPETHAQVERELEQTKRSLAQAEKDLERTDRKRKDANASASRWRKRYEALRDQPTVAAAPPTPAPKPAAAPASPSPAPTAAIAPPVAPAAPISPREAAADAFAPEASPAPVERGMLPADGAPERSSTF